MFAETKITWDKVVLEIQNLSAEGWESVAPLLIATDHLVSPASGSDQVSGQVSDQMSVDRTFRRLHFMVFELVSLCEGLNEKERLDKLIEFYFHKKNFQIHGDKNSLQAISLKECMLQSNCHPMVGICIFLHLAFELQIPLFWAKFKDRYIVKWMRSGRCDYFDFLSPDRFLNESEILNIFKTGECSVECWGAREAYQMYLSLLVTALENTGETHALHTAYSLSVQADQCNTHLLGRRAFLRHKMGYTKEAHMDLKRYFSFVDKERAPVEIQELYLQVSASLDQSLDIPSGAGPVYH